MACHDRPGLLARNSLPGERRLRTADESGSALAKRTCAFSDLAKSWCDPFKRRCVEKVDTASRSRKRGFMCIVATTFVDDALMQSTGVSMGIITRLNRLCSLPGAAPSALEPSVFRSLWCVLCSLPTSVNKYSTDRTRRHTFRDAGPALGCMQIMQLERSSSMRAQLTRMYIPQGDKSQTPGHSLAFIAHQ